MTSRYYFPKMLRKIHYETYFHGFTQNTQTIEFIMNKKLVILLLAPSEKILRKIVSMNNWEQYKRTTLDFFPPKIQEDLLLKLMKVKQQDFMVRQYGFWDYFKDLRRIFGCITWTIIVRQRICYQLQRIMYILIHILQQSYSILSFDGFTLYILFFVSEKN